MPLSAREQRTLDEIEQALRLDDPAFAAQVDLDHLRMRRWVIRGSVFLAGMALLVVGAVLSLAVLTVGVATSVIGFLVMAASPTVASGRRGDG
jgi:hypothetical protein